MSRQMVIEAYAETKKTKRNSTVCSVLPNGDKIITRIEYWDSDAQANAAYIQQIDAGDDE